MIWWLAAAVVALEIPYPLVQGDARNLLTVATVVVFALASLTDAVARGGWKRGVALLIVAGGGGLVAEAVGVHTGVPFGDYHYTGGLGVEVWGVPVVVPLAWVMMSHPSACVAARLTVVPWQRAALAALALASWDVFLDPQMVAAHHWQWASPAPHLPGIGDVPLSNFGGWLLVSLALMALLHVATGSSTAVGTRSEDRPMLTLWVWTWVSSTFANLAFFHRPAVAAWGFVAMGVVGLALLRVPARTATVPSRTRVTA